MSIPISHIITPGGVRHKSRVHRVTHTGVVHYSEGALHQGTPTTVGNQIQPLRPALVGTVPPPPPPGPGWIETAGVQATASLTTLTGSWLVPPAPKISDHQVLFLSLGLETTDRPDTTDLMRVALQWGYNGSFGGEHWVMCCWYQHFSSAEDAKLMCSNYVTVEEGERITASLALKSWDGHSGWECTAQGQAACTAAALRVTGVSPPNFLLGNLGIEAYHPDGKVPRNLLPNGEATKFSGLGVGSSGGNITPAWQSEIKVPSPGRRVEVIGPSEVDLFY